MEKMAEVLVVVQGGVAYGYKGDEPYVRLAILDMDNLEGGDGMLCPDGRRRAHLSYSPAMEQLVKEAGIADEVVFFHENGDMSYYGAPEEGIVRYGESLAEGWVLKQREGGNG
jgi:hypothetical protein